MPITDDELREMQDPNSWIFPADAITLGLDQHARAVVSVAFNHAEFERVYAYATAREATLSALVREAVLRHIEDSDAAAPDEDAPTDERHTTSSLDGIFPATPSPTIRAHQ